MTPSSTTSPSARRADRRLGPVRRGPRRNLGLRRRLPRLLVGPAEVRRGAEDRAADPDRRPRRGLPGALPGRSRRRPAPLQLHRQRHRGHAGPDPGPRHRARRGQPGQPELEGGVPAPAQRPRHRHPGRPAGRFPAHARAAGAARARTADPLRPDRAPRQRPRGRDAAVPRGPGRPARTAGDDAAELTWPGGRRLRLVRQDGLPRGGALHHVRFTRAEGIFAAGDRERAGLLSKRLGLTVELAAASG